MQLHWGWAIPAALLLGGALVWWTQPSQDERGEAPSRHPADADRKPAAGDAGPTLYRWVDAHGIVNISTDKPRAGIRYTVVHVNPDQNVVPMGRHAGNGER